MFTGLVEETGVVHALTADKNSICLRVLSRVCARETKAGDSIAVNGCCLTVTRFGTFRKQRVLEFNILRETAERTNLSLLGEGSLVNLERALRADTRLGGHFVSGHIEGTAEIKRWERAGRDHLLELQLPPGLMRYVIHKGSICVDGISLTVAEISPRGIRIWIIPHTLEQTNLRTRQPGDHVNIETDLLAKYVERLLGRAAVSKTSRSGSGVPVST